MMGNKKVSIIDIAELAGVSVATVSRVLNKNGRYSAETEKRVLDIIEKCNYRKNINASTLRTNISQSIGVIVPDITNEFFAKIVQAVQAAAILLDYSVFICDFNEDEKLENILIQNLQDKNVDGIIYISGKMDIKVVKEKHDIPTVYIDRRPQNASILIQSDNTHGGRLAAGELLDKGCKRIMMLRDYRMVSSTRHRYKGYLQAHEERKVDIDPELLIDIHPTYIYAKNRVGEIIDRGIEFDGIFAINDITALGALHALHENNVLVPEQVKLVGFDGISATEFCTPTITTIQQNTEQIGKTAVETLMGLINGNKPDKNEIIIPVNIIRRETTM